MRSNFKGRAAAPIAAAALGAAGSALLAVLAAVLAAIAASPAHADTIPKSDLPSYLRDSRPKSGSPSPSNGSDDTGLACLVVVTPCIATALLL